MRILLAAILTFLTTELFAQNGYVILNNDSILSGYLRHYVSANDGRQGIELWKTKNDKDPRKISKGIIREYAIKKDTFKVFHQYAPFPDGPIYFEQVDAKLLQRGKFNLYVINTPDPGVTPYVGGVTIGVTIKLSGWNQPVLYVLEENATGFYKALPSERESLKQILMELYPERYITKYDEVMGKIKYSSIPDLVQLYNSK